MKPTKKNYGGGSGTHAFESKLFRVVLWNSQRGANTELEFNDGWSELVFDGDQRENLSTDCKCLAAMRPSDLLKLLRYVRKEGKEEGRSEVQQEIRKALGR